MVLFSILTLPVEIDASRRGLRLLREAGLFQNEEDERGARTMLTAAGLTYLAAAITSILTLLYYIARAQQR
jgi:Zn-dependent membrane protease YugP